MTRYWVSRLGRGGKYIDHGKKGSYIAIGWPLLGGLEWLEKDKTEMSNARNKLKKDYAKASGEDPSSMKVAIECGELWNFILEMSNGDIVLLPDPRSRTVHIGRITGPYQYKEDWEDGCEYVRRRKVNWLKEVPRGDVSVKLSNSVGSIMTVFSVDRHVAEIEALISGKEYVEPRPKNDIKGEALTAHMIEKMMNLDAKRFEEFVSTVLNALGIQAATTRMSGDKGIDIVGTLNAEGLASVNIHIQVKRISASLGIKEVQRLRGTLGPDDQGTIITTGRFTNQAQEEAEESGRKPIRLISGKEFAELVLEVYDQLDDAYKSLFGLKKVDIPLVKQYHVPGISGDQELQR